MHPLLRQAITRGWETHMTQAWELWAEHPTPANRRLARAIARIFITSPNPHARNEAVEALGELGNRADLHAIIGLQNDPWDVVRASVASSLASLGGRSMLARIKAMAEDQSPLVRRYAYVAAHDSGGDDAIPWLRQQRLIEEHDWAFIGIELVLADQGDELAVHRLFKYASLPHSGLCYVAASTLKELGLEPPPNPLQPHVDARQRDLKAEEWAGSGCDEDLVSIFEVRVDNVTLPEGIRDVWARWIHASAESSEAREAILAELAAKLNVSRLPVRAEVIHKSRLPRHLAEEGQILLSAPLPPIRATFSASATSDVEAERVRRFLDLLDARLNSTGVGIVESSALSDSSCQITCCGYDRVRLHSFITKLGDSQGVTFTSSFSPA